MKKSIIKTLRRTVLCFALMFSITIIASADTATSVVAGPSLKLHQWCSGSTYSLTPGGGYPEGSKSYVYFSGYGELPSSFAKDNNRALEIFLMEDDFLNEDDTVKSYYGTFTGWKLTSMRYSNNATSGDIDSDNTAEMYIDAKLYRTTNDNLTDPSNGTAAGKLFNYQIGINS